MTAPAPTSPSTTGHPKSPMILFMVMLGTVLAMVTSACAASPTTSAPAASSSVQPSYPAATSQATTTATTSPEQVLKGLCTRNCFELKAISQLPACNPSA